MKRVILVYAACLGVFTSFVFAATEQPLNIKTGLWQIDMTLNYSGLPPGMQAMLDRLTPEQRAEMGFGAPKTFKRCVTSKNVNTPWTKADDNCKWTVHKSSGSDLEMTGKSCRAGKGQGLSTDVDVKIHAVDSEHVQATMHGTATGNGVNAKLDGTYAGKWVGASCPANME